VFISATVANPEIELRATFLVNTRAVSKTQQKELDVDTGGNAGKRFGCLLSFRATPSLHLSSHKEAASVVSAVPISPIWICFGDRGEPKSKGP
jgi:hypothetical protein